MQKYVGRFREKKPDWAAFEDAKIEGYKRAQHRFIGAGGSGKHNDPTVIPARTSRCRSCMWSRSRATPRTPTRWRNASSCFTSRELSDLMGKRYFLLQRLVWAMENPKDNNVEKIFAEYYDVVKDW